MSIEQLKKELKEARKAYRADKSDKALKKAFKAAKKALSEAEEAQAAGNASSNGKKRPLPETEETPKKKAKTGPSVEDLQASVKKARKAWKANKEDKELKAKLKEAKAALAEAQEKESAQKEAEETTNEEKPDIAALKEAVQEARKAFRADKSDKSLKKKLKEAKAALAAAQEAVASSTTEAKESEDTPMEPAKEEASKEDEASKKEEDPTMDFLANLKAEKPKRTSNNAPSNTLWIGNMSFDVDDDKLKEFLKDCGEVTSIRWLTNRDTGKFKGCGFISFATIEEATKAFNKGGEEFMGREFRVDYDTPRAPRKPEREKAPPSTRLFLGNVSYDADDDKLREHFKDCGELADIFWVTDRDTGDFRGFGFCTFHDQESADKAYAMNGQEFCGRPLKIDYTKPRENKSGGRRGSTRKLSEKLPGCTAVFVGGLPDDIDDDKITAFFADVGPISQIRWLTDKQSGEFKGAGFIEFENTDHLDAAVGKNGQDCHGRSIRVDYAKPRDRS